MPFKVRLLPAVADDLEELFDYVAENDSLDKAAHVIDEINKVIGSLSTVPGRGRRVKELEYLGVQAYRELSFKPYRIIYRMSEEVVSVFMILDGRRDCRDILQDRLLDR